MTGADAPRYADPVHVLPLSSLSAADASRAGGKGASLGELIKAGIPVPPGFVVLTDAFDRFLAESGIKADIDAELDRVDHRAVHTVEAASERIHALVTGAELPADLAGEIVAAFGELREPLVAVRSSATAEDGKEAAWAGQLETYLNTGEADLLENVRRCWASLFSPRAIVYRFEKGMRDHPVSVAVVVQAMVQSEVSGIAFSVHPVTQDRDQMIVEASYGLGEAIVSGAITPDSYVLRKSRWSEEEVTAVTKERMLTRSADGNAWKPVPAKRRDVRALCPEDLLRLGKLVARIEDHYGFPVDVEWAQRGKELFITQSRPITTLSAKAPKKAARGDPAGIRAADYIALFKLQGAVGCLNAEFFVSTSLGLGDPVVVYKDGHWHTYLRRDGERRCQERGLEIFRSEDSYRAYAEGFRAYIAEARKNVIPRFTTPVLPSKEELQTLLAFFSQENYYYGMTEFCYHDLAYEIAQETQDPVLLNNLKDLGRLKFEGRAILNAYIHGGGVYDNILIAISRKFLRNEDDARYLWTSELLGLYDGVGVPEALIAERKYAFGCLSVQGTMRVFTQAEALRVWDELHPPTDRSIIAGIAASPGTAQGRVVIAPMLVDPEAIAAIQNRMRKGDVLVAESTTPELMGLCQMASAIVADQGGMLSHAAVVSRELNIPCVIATGHATETLENGDLVEVDGDAATVRILERASGKGRYLFSWGERHSVISAESWMRGYVRHRQIIGNENTDVFMPVVVGITQTHNAAAELPLALEAGRKTLRPGFLAAHLRTAAAPRAAFRSFVTRLRETRLRAAPNAALLELFTRYMDLFDRTWAIFKVSQPEYLEAARLRLRELLAGQVPDIERAFILLTTPTEADIIKEEALAAIALSLRGRPTKANLLRHVEHFPWLCFNTYDRDVILAYLRHNFAELSAVPAPERRARLRRIRSEIRSHASEVSRTIRGLKSRTEITRISSLFQSLAVDRLRLKAWWGGAEYLCLPLFEEIARRAGLSAEQLLMRYAVADIERLLRDGTRLPEATGANRERLYAFALREGTLRLMERQDAETAMETLLDPPEPEGRSEAIAGTTANLGKATGIARVVPVEDLTRLLVDMNRFRAGDVLVTTMTQPTMVALAAKAAAIVTDEGGITSHASILAREYGIPCIVGTRIATRAIRDGDLVEVDGDAGTVRILERAAPAAPAETMRAKGREWFLTVTRNMSFWHQCLLVEGWKRDMPAFGVNWSLDILSLTEHGTRSHCFFHAENYAGFNAAVERVFLDARALARLKKAYAAHAKSLLSALDDCLRSLTVQRWETFLERYRVFTAGLQITNAFGKHGTDALMALLQERGLSTTEASRTAGVITYPSAHTPLFRSRERLLEVGADVQAKHLDARGKTAALSSWVAEFGNIPVNYCDEPWTLADARAQLDDILQEPCAEKLVRARASHRRKTSAARRRLKELDDPAVTTLAGALAACTSLNEFRKNVFSTVSLRFRPVFGKIAKLCGSNDWRACFFLTPAEMAAALRGEAPDLEQLQRERDSVALLCDENGAVRFVDPSDADAALQVVRRREGRVPDPVTQTDLLRGFSANGGKVRGPAKVVSSSKDFGGFSAGDVLVAPMTSVDYVPLMEKAAAFVTNEGGITSHASIVAREMDKPCVIGTKTATRVIRDSDLVEVDGDAGTVRILKHA